MGGELLIAALFFLLACVMSVFSAANLFIAARETIQLTWLFAVFVMLSSVIPKYDLRATLIALVLASGILTSMVGVYEYFWVREPVDMLVASTRLRSTGIYDQPNAYGSFLIGSIPLLAGILVFDDLRKYLVGRWRAVWPQVSMRPLLWIILALLAFTLAATFSRGSWVGWGIGFTVLFFLGRSWFSSRRFFAVVATCLLSVSAVLVDVSFQPSVIDRSFSNTQRLKLLESSWKMFLDYPFTGVGNGNFSVLLPRYADEELLESMQRDFDPVEKKFYRNPQKQPDIEIVHNVLAQVTCETGIAGLLTFLAFWFFYFRKVMRTLNNLQSSTDRFLVIAALASVAAMLGAALFGWPFTHGVQELLVLQMALTMTSAEPKA